MNEYSCTGTLAAHSGVEFIVKDWYTDPAVVPLSPLERFQETAPGP